jgi:outer membrane lipoprotein-sorting protein
MKDVPRFSRRARWAVPAGAVALVAAVTAGSLVTVAEASPALPPRTPAQLLAAFAANAGTPPPLAGTVVETAALGIPQLPGDQNPSSILSMLSGSHTIKVWYADPAHVRLALPVPMGETDLIRNGAVAWVWQSSTDSVTRIPLPAISGRLGPGRPPGASPDGGAGSPVPLTPQQAAQRVLAAAGPTTSVRTGSSTTVVGQDAYQLVIAPRDSRSLIGSVVIALDAQHPGVPLRVQVFARGAAAPAFQVGYTGISFGAPPASTFDFTPPPGASVHTVTPPGPPTGWTGIAPRRAMLRGGRACFMPRMGVTQRVSAGVPRKLVVKRLPAGAAPPNVVVKGAVACIVVPNAAVKGAPAGWTGAAPCSVVLRGMPVGWTGSGPPPLPFGPPFGGPQVIGSGWLSVVALPASVLSGLSNAGSAAGALGQAARSAAHGPGAGAGSGNSAAILAALLESAKPVHGAWGSGKLLQTSLVSVLITSNGHVLMGAVAPSVLYSAAGQVK